jgi:hypothetical protein
MSDILRPKSHFFQEPHLVINESFYFFRIPFRLVYELSFMKKKYFTRFKTVQKSLNIKKLIYPFFEKLQKANYLEQSPSPPIGLTNFNLFCSFTIFIM